MPATRPGAACSPRSLRPRDGPPPSKPSNARRASSTCLRQIRALMPRVRMRVDPDIPGDLERHMWTRVTVRLADGRRWSVGPREVPGHPSNPLTPQALREKFEECARLALPADRVESVRQMLEGLETCPDL